MFTHTSRITVIALACILAAGALAAAPSGVVNVNTAAVDQLELLPRIGPTIAARIIEHRDEHGAFDAPEDLLLVKGIGDVTFERLAPYVAVSGETTLTERVRSTARKNGDED